MKHIIYILLILLLTFNNSKAQTISSGKELGGAAVAVSLTVIAALVLKNQERTQQKRLQRREDFNWEKPKMGIFVGYNFSNMKMSLNNNDVSSTGKSAMHIGFNFDLPIARKFHLVPGFMYNGGGGAYSFSDSYSYRDSTGLLYNIEKTGSSKVITHGLTFFMDLRYKADLGKYKIFASAGPYGSVITNGRVNIDQNTEKTLASNGEITNESEEIKKSMLDNNDYAHHDLGVSIGGGVQINNIGLHKGMGNTTQFGIYYDIGLKNLAENGDYIDLMNTSTIRFSITYYLTNK